MSGSEYKNLIVEKLEQIDDANLLRRICLIIIAIIEG